MVRRSRKLPRLEMWYGDRQEKHVAVSLPAAVFLVGVLLALGWLSSKVLG